MESIKHGIINTINKPPPAPKQNKKKSGNVREPPNGKFIKTWKRTSYLFARKNLPVNRNTSPTFGNHIANANVMDMIDVDTIATTQYRGYFLKPIKPNTSDRMITHKIGKTVNSCMNNAQFAINAQTSFGSNIARND
jgi:hypothetical protein